MLRICDECLRKDDWHRFGLVERHPILQEVPTEFFEGEWHFPKADGPEPWAVITYTYKPSPETGHVGWCWWAMGSMGEASTYEAACEAAIRHLHIFGGPMFCACGRLDSDCDQSRANCDKSRSK
jgi:hypothetical protein